MTRVAIMQPYFVPYLGYFRLFSTTDIFVILDSVQFSSDGYVHRNRLLDHLDRPQWLKLPLAKVRLGTRICNLTFDRDAASRLNDQFKMFPALVKPRPEGEELMRLMLEVEGTPVDYLVRTMHCVCDLLRAPWHVVKSSEMQISPDLRGQDRVIEIVRQLGGSVYINAPGGRSLYEVSVFRHAGISLKFLSDYTGTPWSILWRLATDRIEELRTEFSESSTCGN
jgi:hypothetical protein